MSLNKANFKAIAVSGVFLILFICSFSVKSLTAVERTFEELVALADYVIIGQVTRITSVKQPDSQKIYSYVTFSDLEIIKGDYDDDEYIVKHRGGIVDNMGEMFPGMPEFEQNQRYIIFVRDNFHDLFPIVGIHQGIQKIEWDSEQNTDVVVPIEGETMNDINSNPNLSARSRSAATSLDTQKQKMPLHQYVQRIRTLLEQSENGP